MLLSDEDYIYFWVVGNRTLVMWEDMLVLRRRLEGGPGRLRKHCLLLTCFPTRSANAMTGKCSLTCIKFNLNCRQFVRSRQRLYTWDSAPLERLRKHEHIAWGKAVSTGKLSQDSLCLLFDVKGLEADLHYPGAALGQWWVKLVLMHASDSHVVPPSELYLPKPQLLDTSCGEHSALL